ncbi:MAG: outer membrane protein transport protein [Sterolibacterium sp.]|nr:outer membrane protein transport protein [Sterolibacterium sp.]
MLHTRKIIALTIAAALSPAAFASGFALSSQNGSGNGNAFAGGAATAEDASTIFSNPAGMALLPEGHHIAAAATLLNRSLKFNDTSTAPIAGQPLGTNGGNAGGHSIIPAGYWTMSLSPALRIGVGVSPTFGNKSEYTPDFIGRFAGYYTELKQININPSIAYKVNDALSLGFGVNMAKNEIEFRQKVASPLGPVTFKLEGEDTAWGWNIGAMYQIAPSTRLGAAYRSKIKFDLEGHQLVTLDANGATLAPVSYPIRSILETPDTFSMALSQRIDRQWELLADLTWTGWSSVNSLPVIQSSSGNRVNSLTYNFKNTWRAGLGANYQLNDAWKLRAGMAHDESPIKANADRTLTLPDSNRTWLSLGTRYSLSKTTSVDVGYSHIFFKDSSTDRTVLNPSTGAAVQQVRGNFEASAEYLSFQLNHHF